MDFTIQANTDKSCLNASYQYGIPQYFAYSIQPVSVTVHPLKASVSSYTTMQSSTSSSLTSPSSLPITQRSNNTAIIVGGTIGRVLIFLLGVFSALWWTRNGSHRKRDVTGRTTPTGEEPREVVYTGDNRDRAWPVPYSYNPDVQLPEQRPDSSSMMIMGPPQPRPIQEVDGGAFEEPENLPPHYEEGIAIPQSRRTSVARVSKRRAGV